MAAKKRVTKLEQEGIIRGYNTCIYRDGEITMLVDIVTVPEKFEDVLNYVSTQTAFVRQIFTTTKEKLFMVQFDSLQPYQQDSYLNGIVLMNRERK